MSEARGEEPLLATLLGPDRFEVRCETCFELLDRYVEVELAGGEAEDVAPGVLPHLTGCLACREDYQSLHAFLRTSDYRRGGHGQPHRRLERTQRRGSICPLMLPRLESRAPA